MRRIFVAVLGLCVACSDDAATPTDAGALTTTGDTAQSTGATGTSGAASTTSTTAGGTGTSGAPSTSGGTTGGSIVTTTGGATGGSIVTTTGGATGGSIVTTSGGFTGGSIVTTSGGFTGGSIVTTTGGATGGFVGGTSGTSGTSGGAEDAGAATSGGGDSSVPVDPNDPFSEVRQVCVDTINEYRATLGLAPIVRASNDVEMCSDGGAKQDADTGQAHGSAFSCPGRGAQNTCPAWPVGGFSGNATLADALKGCLKAMWEEDEPAVGREECLAQYFAGDSACFLAHGHYLNMSDPAAKSVACGFYDMGNNRYWMNQDFGSR